MGGRRFCCSSEASCGAEAGGAVATTTVRAQRRPSQQEAN